MEVLTPVRTPTNGRGRKSLGVALALDDTHEIGNNDGLDKRRRHQDLMAEKKRKNTGSFIGTNGQSNVESSAETGVSNLSDSRLAELYATSLKLSAENKINNNNAFALPIIDVFARMLKSPNFTQNFQMTSRSLDASAKVYSCRVDYVHAETFRIAGELAISKKRKKDDQSPEDVDNDLTPLEKKRKKKDRKKSKTIETNLKNIDQVKQLEDQCILLIDPLFNQMSLLFSEEGVNGLIFNNSTQDQTCLIPIDSRQRVTRNSNNAGTPIPYQMDHEKISAISCKFADCFYIGFTVDDTTHHNLICSKNQSLEAQEVFQSTMCQDDMGFDMAPDDDDEEELVFKEPLAPAPLLDEVAPVEMQEASTASIMTSMLASEPGEYSYLDEHMVAAWAGPDYWKYQPSLRRSQQPDHTDKASKKNVTKNLQNDYCTQLDKKAVLSSSSTTSELMRPTLLNWDRKKTTYPKDIQYKSSNFCRLGPRACLKPILEDQLRENEDTDYEDNMEDDEEDDMFNHQAEDALVEDLHNTSDEEQVPESQPVFSQEPPLSQEPDNYDPNAAINKFTLNYAKRAKRINVKNLKQNMWKLLASEAPHVPGAPVPDKMTREMCFSQLYQELPSHVSESNAESLTVPLAFVCFLHMTNEKVLELEQQTDMADFTIRQG